MSELAPHQPDREVPESPITITLQDDAGTFHVYTLLTGRITFIPPGRYRLLNQGESLPAKSAQ